jgi:hypothetical protein
MYVYSIEMYIHSIYIGHVFHRSICQLAVLTQFVGRCGQSSNPQELYCFKWEFCVQFARHFPAT